MTFSEKYIQLCAEHNEKPTALAEKLGFSRASGSKWSNGGEANKTALRAIANYFGVSVEYLRGDEEKEKPAPTDGDGIQDLIQIYNELDSSRRSKLLELARLYLEDQRKISGK